MLSILRFGRGLLNKKKIRKVYKTKNPNTNKDKKSKYKEFSYFPKDTK